MGYQVTPLKDLQVRDVRASLLIFAGAVAFVLLIACANVANLLLIRAASREREIAIRSALGAGRLRLIRQLLTESTLLGLAGGAVGILFALWGVPALLALAPEGKVPRLEEIHIDGSVLAFTLAVSLLTGIAFGLAPAFRATTPRHLHRDRPTNLLRSGLVIAEIALALVLVTGAGLMLKSFIRMQAVDPGFRPEQYPVHDHRSPELGVRHPGPPPDISPAACWKNSPPCRGATSRRSCQLAAARTGRSSSAISRSTAVENCRKDSSPTRLSSARLFPHAGHPRSRRPRFRPARCVRCSARRDREPSRSHAASGRERTPSANASPSRTSPRQKTG